MITKSNNFLPRITEAVVERMINNYLYPKNILRCRFNETSPKKLGEIRCFLKKKLKRTNGK